MSAKETQHTGLGLFQNIFHPQSFTSFAANAQQAPDQMMRGFARWQVEVQNLAVRRAQAYLELPSRLSQCRTPQDLMAEQQRFMQTCMGQWTESTRAIMGAWMQMFQVPVAGGDAARKETGRDYLSFPDPRTLNGAAKDKDEPHQAGRKVA